MRRLAFGAILVLTACSDASGPVPGGSWASVAAGDQFTCALTLEGAAFCWGAGAFGQLGNDTTLNRAAPAPVAGGHVFRALSAGSDHACAIDDAHATWCWGLNDFRELGAPTSFCNNNLRFVTCARVPVKVAAAPALDSITVHGYASCGLASTGEAYCWGWNDHGQVGSGVVGAVVTSPQLVSGTTRFRAISLDLYHACAVTTSAALSCWGSNVYGQLAPGFTPTPPCGGSGFPCATVPIVAAAGIAAAGTSAGGTHSCAVSATQALWCWGSNQYGVLGSPAASGGPIPVSVPTATAWSRVDAGDDHTCALDVDGAAWCWGVNTHGQLGAAVVQGACPAFGSVALCATAPGRVETNQTFVSISAGMGHTCAVATDHRLWCWGRGTAGQLGNGASQSGSVPVEVRAP